MSPIKIHPIQTGLVKIKTNQLKRSNSSLPAPLNLLLAKEWTDWVPILAWLIEHPEGLFMVDSGETSHTATPGYFPGWQPYYRFAVRFDVKPEDEIGPQLQQLNFNPAEVKQVILTHLHTDHAGGLHHFPNSEILIEPTEYDYAASAMGKIFGYLPHRWPEWLNPTPIVLKDEPYGPFTQSLPLTSDGAIRALPTPGHTPTHISVAVEIEGITYFLAGDTSYTQEIMLEGEPDGVGEAKSVETLQKIQQLARQRPTVYLPSHDPASIQRFQAKQTVYQ